MGKYFVTLSGFVLPIAVSAHGVEEESSGIGHQLTELLPFEHLEEGHWLAVVLSFILWASLAYTVYALVRKFRTGA